MASPVSSAVDSRTITRPTRTRTSILPEATPESASSPVMAENSSEKFALSPSPAATPTSAADRRPQRQRQATVTMQSNLIQAIHDAFKKAAEISPADALSEAEKRVLALVGAKESEWVTKNEKLSQLLVGTQKEAARKEDQADADIRFLKAVISDYEKKHTINGTSPIAPSVRTPTGIPGSRSQQQLDGAGPSNLLLAQLKAEKEHLADEAERLHGQYSSLYKTYEKQRSAIEMMKKELEGKEHAETELNNQLQALEDRYKKLHDTASNEINRANKMIMDLKKQHDEDTLALRMNLKKKETELEATQKQLAIKKKEAEELNQICAQLIEKAEREMGESMTSSIASSKNG